MTSALFPGLANKILEQIISLVRLKSCEPCVANLVFNISMLFLPVSLTVLVASLSGGRFATATAQQQCSTGDVRLSSGSDFGRVEICFNGIWGTMCDDFWDNYDASVVCRQLGYSPFGAIGTHGSYTEGNLPMHVIDINCTGDEMRVLDCPHNNLVGEHICNLRQDASVRCQAVGSIYSNCSDGDLRLVGDSTDYQGRVEVCINNVWGSICYSTSRYNYWDVNDGRVVCRNLGHQELGLTVYQTTTTQFGQGSGPVFLADVRCTGSETTLLECTHTVFVGTSCTHSRDIGVKCQPLCTSGSIRITNSSSHLNSSFGRVEVCVNETWGTICSDFWENEDASVVCKQLGYTEYGAVAGKSSYTESVWPFHIIDLNCSGTENTVWECPYNDLFRTYTCDSRRDASVRCQVTQVMKANCSDGDVRLVNGSVINTVEGRVEICINQVWGTVCSTTHRYSYSRWDVNDAKVVCHQLGNQELGALVFHSSDMYANGIDPGPIVLSDLNCAGTESNLLLCRSSDFIQLGDNPYCSHSRDVGVKCQPLCTSGSIRITNSSSHLNSSFGRVEVCVNETWGTICSDFWENEDASVVCQQLGYTNKGAVAGKLLYTESVWPFHIVDLNCSATENTVWECPHNGLFDSYSCRSSNDASVRCQEAQVMTANCSDGDVRLVNGSVVNTVEGRVEICINQVWGTVCSTTHRYSYSRWDVNDAKVVCRQLGNQELGATVFSNSDMYGTGNDPILLSDLGCSGTESNLLQCQNTNFVQLGNIPYCSHSRDVGIRCEPVCSNGAIRLASTTVNLNTYTGRVEVCVNGTWGTICSDFWENDDATVVCKQLGFSEYGAVAGRDTYTETIWPFHVVDLNCTGTEETVWECPHSNLLGVYNCETRKDASIVCQGMEVVSSNCSEGDVRLVDGLTDYEGRVEICINQVWGTVCLTTYRYYYYYYYSRWDINDAMVVCRQLGHQELGATIFTSSSTFGPGNGPVFLSDLRCTGTELDLFDCPHTIFVGTYCNHQRDVGLRCEAKCESGTIRLVSESNSYFRSYGRVELCINETWTTICDEHWDNNDASVVCYQLGYSRYGAIADRNNFIETIWPLAVTNVSCTGNEQRLLECSLSFEAISSCNSRSDASVVCQSNTSAPSSCSTGDIRLSGESSEVSGRLEVCINEMWGTICNYNWDWRDSRVTCRQLSFQPFYGFTESTSSLLYAGIGNGTIYNYRTDCTGSESALIACSSVKYPWAGSPCNHYDDVTIQCVAPCIDGDIRLHGVSSVERAGVVHVCVNGTWGKVCGGENSAGFASVVCSQLGYSQYGAIARRRLWSDGYYVFHMYHPMCNGNESNILDCSYSTQDTIPSTCSSRTVLTSGRYVYGNSDVTSVICLQDSVKAFSCEDGAVRLVGESTYRGRLEICMNQVWGTVCASRGFSTEEANVVCNTLGYQPLGSIVFNTPTSKDNPPMFTDFSCSTISTDLSDCSNPSGITTRIVDCGPSVVGIECVPVCEDGQIRLIGGSSYGRVEVCGSGLWGTVCSDSYWDDIDAGVVCKQLGFSQYGSLALSNWYTERIKIALIHSLECTGSEESIFDCRRNEGDEGCTTRQDASVICYVNVSEEYSNCTTGDVRLVDGPNENKGRVEVCVNNVWASVCISNFNQEEANVICRQLGYLQIGAQIRGAGYYGQGLGPVLRYFGCRGSERSIFECQRYFTYSVSCSHTNDVGLDCELPCANGSVRLAGSQWSYQGRVEVCVNNTWGTICTDYWDVNDTDVVCRQLGFSSSDSQVYNGYGERTWPIHIMDINCTGLESSIWECPHNAINTLNCRSSRNDAALTCSVYIPTCTTEEEGDVRLVDGLTVYEGRVEVCTNGEWGTICNYNWYQQEAVVVCNQLGYPTAGAVATNIYRYGEGVIHFSHFDCVGDEINILSCPHSHPPSYCSHSSDSGVICRAPCLNGDVQLVGDHRYNYFGRVEVCIDGTWGKVCNNMWKSSDASVLCRQLGFSPYGAIPRSSVYQLSALQYYIQSTNCTGNESSVFDCPYTSMEVEDTCNSDAGVICQEYLSDNVPVEVNCTNYDIRLQPISSTLQNRGKVQMCFNGVWGVMCDNVFRGSSSEVICNQLGYQRRGQSRFSVEHNSGDVFMISSIYCSGNEENISQCNVQFYTKANSCNQRLTAGLECVAMCRNGEARIVGSSYPRLGRVEICINGTWGTICDAQYWDNSDASVICRQLGYSPYGAIALYNSFSDSTWPVHVYDLNCTGSESGWEHCPQNSFNPNQCNHRRDAAISCQPLETYPSNCTDGDLRVENMGPNDASGRLEICDNNVWFSVYHTSSWTSSSYRDTPIFACQSLGYGNIDVVVNAINYLDHPYLPLYPTDFRCPRPSSTRNSFLRDCATTYHAGDYTTSTLYEVSISCTSRTTECNHGQVQLVGSDFKQYGRVEVCINGTWGTICNDFWNNTDASVICRQLGYSTHGAITLFGFSGDWNTPTLINDLNCTGDEESFLDCPSNALVDYTCGRYDDAAVLCQDDTVRVSDCLDGDIRLVGGPTPQEGTVQICANNVWGGVCQSRWDTQDANVACSQLGYQPVGATVVYNSFFGKQDGVFYMTNVYCRGSESRLVDCSHSMLAVSSCGDGQYAGVKCLEACEEGSVRLRGSRNAFGGRVEVCVELSWTTICDETWDNLDASVVCHQLGFSPYGAISADGRFTEGQLSFGITDIHCNGTEDNITSCTHNEASLHNCQSHNDAGIVCQGLTTIQSQCDDGELRLVGGSEPNEGRVEVCINQAWGTICDNSWDRNDANVVCGQLGYLQQGAIARYGAYYGVGSGPILLADMYCTGNEASLLNCNSNRFGSLRCNHNEDAGVSCQVPCTNGETRLRGASSLRIGRIEICINETWGTICADGWDRTDASVVCRQLGYSLYGSFAISDQFSDNIWPTLMYDINCDGSEESIMQCPHTLAREGSDLQCQSNHDSSVVCQVAESLYSNCTDGEVRLVGGTTENEGRVEICYGHTWGTICDDGWNHQDANIVCRQLGYQPIGAIALSRAHFMQGNGPILLRNIHCDGTEASLIECQWTVHNIHTYCSHSEDAGVICQGRCTQGSVRVTGANSDRYGAVEVCVNGTWGAVCNDYWDDADARVICKQLGHSEYGALSTGDFSLSSMLPITLVNVSCTGFENSLLQCGSVYVQPLETISCSTKAGVLCQATSQFAACNNGDARLAGGSQDYMGRVEVCVNNAWGTVCDDHWDITERNLICRQLGFQPFGSTLLRGTMFGVGEHSIILAGLNCVGQETSLLKCDRDDTKIKGCSAHEVSGVQCEELCNNGEIRIVGGPTTLIGRVEVCVNRTWGTVCAGETWNDLHASVVCHQVGHSVNGAISGTGGFSIIGRPSYMNEVICDGNETSLFQCSHVIRSSNECAENNIAGVICQALSVEVSDCTHGDVRLTGGRKPTEGRVEVCVHGVWGTACDDGWDISDANVVCGQLGFYPFGAQPRYGAFYGQGSRPLVIADMFCSGTESDVLSCQRNIFGITHCHDYEEAGVKCQGSFPITLSKRIGSLLGGDNIIVSGLTLREDDEISCRFDKAESDGLYVSDTQALCVTPSVEEESHVDFRIIIRRGNNNITGGALYQYISPEIENDIVDVKTEERIIWNSGEMANITWNPSSLIMDEVISNAHVKVDASLLVYNEQTEAFEESVMLATDLPNAGIASIRLPDPPSRPSSDYDVHPAILKLSVNTSTTIVPLNKRAAHRSTLSNLLGKVRRFGRATFITHFKYSVAARLACEVWAAATPRFPQRSIPPCPCKKSDIRTEDNPSGADDRYVQEKHDNLRNFFHPNTESCFRQANVRDFSPGQQCCYDNSGNIITGTNGGTADLVAPIETKWETVALHLLVDVAPWFLCCTGLFKDCSRYTSRRPVDDCSEWPERPPPARMFGDPHIVTLDGYEYTFNGNGEFILAETLDGLFVLQGRMVEPILSTSSESLNATIGGTSFEALAMKEGENPTVQLEISNSELMVLVDGDRIDFSALSEQRFSNVTITDIGNSTFTVRFTSGVSVTVTKFKTILTNILITLPEHFATRGLLGQFNGDPNDDLLPRNNPTPLQANSTIETIHYNFGITWIINDPHQSLFTYGPNGDWEFYYRPEYNPIFRPNFSDPELEEQARETCGNDQLCLFDIAATGNVDVGSSTMESVRQQEISRTQFVPRTCDLPCLNGACIGDNTCICSEGYTGSSCENQVLVDCDINICENGGECQLFAGDYVCYCSPEYTGAICQTKVEIPTTVQENNIPLGVIVGSAVGGFVLLLIVLITIVSMAIVIVCYANHKKNKANPYQGVEPKNKESVEMDKISNS